MSPCHNDILTYGFMLKFFAALSVALLVIVVLTQVFAWLLHLPGLLVLIAEPRIVARLFAALPGVLCPPRRGGGGFR